MFLRHRIGPIGLLLGCCLVVAACGGGGDDTDVGDAAPTSAEQATTEAPSPPTDAPTTTDPPTPTPDQTTTAAAEPVGATRVDLPGPSTDIPRIGPPAVFVTDDGTPRLVHLVGDSEVAMTTCSDPMCNATMTVTLVDIAPAGRLDHRGIGFAGDGRPMVLYEAVRNPDADPPQPPFQATLWCTDPACVDVENRDLPELANRGFGPGALVTSPDGRRWRTEIAIGGGGTIDLRLADCTNSYCTSTSADTVLSSTEFLFEEVAVAFDQDRRLAFAFTTTPRSRADVRTLRYARCTDNACTSEPAPSPLLEGAPGDQGISERFDPQPPVFTGNGVTIVVGAAGGGLPRRVLAIRCDDATCASAAATTLFTDVGEGLAAAIGPDGLPRIAWTDSTGVNYSRCLTPDCSSTETTSTGLTADALALAITDDATYLVTGITPVALVVCPEDRCDP